MKSALAMFSSTAKETSAEELYLNPIYLVKEVIDVTGPHATLDTDTIVVIRAVFAHHNGYTFGSLE